jgi:dTDP-4-dehydrorhamnose reductase
VFDGAGRQPYVESDPVRPQSEYGRSKLAGEVAVAGAAPDAHTIVRTAWLFGLGGACFPATIMRLAAQRDVLNVVEDQIGCPTFTGHLAPTLVALAAAREARGVVHAVAADYCSWFEFATEIVALAGLRCEVRPTSTEAMRRPAPRPAWSVLGSERGTLAPRLPHWRQGLKEYMSLAVNTT